jgi:hypothetical protein
LKHPLLPLLCFSAAATLLQPVAMDMASEVASLAGLQTVAAQLDTAGTAEAAFIRRGKLKKKRTAGYRVVVVVGDDTTNNEVHTVDVAFPALDGGGSIPDVTINKGTHARVRFVQNPGVPVLISSWGAVLEMVWNPPSGPVTAAAVLESPEPFAPGATANVVTDSGLKATVRVKANGTLKVTVFHEDKAWDATALGDVSISDGDMTHVLVQGMTTRRYKANVDTSEVPGDLDGLGYTLAVEAKDEAGNVLDSSTQTLVVGDDPVGPALFKSRISDSEGDVRLVTWTDGDGGAALDVSVVDDAGKALLGAIDEMPVGFARLYSDRTLTFEDPTLAADEAYAAVVDLRSADGSSLGAAEVTLVVEGLDVVDPQGTGFTVGPTDDRSAGLISIAQIDETNFALNVVVTTDVAWVEVIFSDSTGPQPIPGELNLKAPIEEHQKWEIKGLGGLGALADGGGANVTVTLLDEAGEVLDVAGAGVGGLPETVFSKRRPKAPKGQIRSPKVRSTVDVL